MAAEAVPGLFLLLFAGAKGNIMELNEFFAQHSKAALGFSGGVDSAYLLYEAHRLGAQVQPYYIKTAFQPAFELRDAHRLCGQLGINLKIIELDILSVDAVRANPQNRCYHCKAALFGALRTKALADGYSLLIDGTNASDDAGDRPGMRALRELSVRSPLRECGITKDEVRRRSREAGLFTWDKPAYACLATRVPAGQALDAETLSRVEQAEEALSGLGFSDFRVRVFYGAARLQFPASQMGTVIARKEEVLNAVKPHFAPVLLDLQGR